MDHRLLLAALLIAAAPACGARVDILNTGEGGSGGAGVGGAGGSNTGPASTGHGVGPGSSVSSGPGSSVSSGPGTTVATSVGSGPDTSAVSTGTGTMICPSFGDMCTSCVATSCPDTWCTCRNDKECFALQECFNGCGSSTACEQMCQTAHPNGISELYLVSDCAGTFCEMQCPGNKSIDPCSKCLLQDCSAEMNACEADPACIPLYQCLSDCGSVNLTCQQGCYAQANMTTAAELQKVLMCEQAACSSQCM